MLEHPDCDPADNVDECDNDTSYRITPYEFARTVHRPVEVSLFGDLLSSSPRFLLVDEPGVEIGVDRHLFSRHRIEGEAGTHFADALGPFGDDDEVDRHEHDEDDDPHDVVPAYDELTETLDHLSRRIRPLVTMEQDPSSGGHVERESKERCDEQKGWKSGDLEWIGHIDGGHQHHQRERDARREQNIEQERGHGEHHRSEDREDQDDDNGIGVLVDLVDEDIDRFSHVRFSRILSQPFGYTL